MVTPRTASIVPRSYGLGAKNPTDGLGLFYKDSAFGWGKSPTATSVSPMLNADINRPTYSDMTLAANNRVLVDGVPQKVAWIRGKPHTFIDGESVPLSGDDLDNFIWYGNKPELVSTGVKDKFIDVGTKVYPEDTTNLPDRSQMQNLAQEMTEIGRLMRAGASGNIYDPLAPAVTSEVYYGSPTEPGLAAIQANARRGGSGSWINDRQGEDFNLFQANTQSQGDSMLAEDYARGGTRISGGGITSAYPAVEETDFVSDRVRYDRRGFMVDAQGTRPIPQVIRALTPASEFYTNTPQVTRDLRTGAVITNQANPVLRFDTNPETPLSPVTVNEFGLVTSTAKPARIARSVQLRNNSFPVDTREKVFVRDGSEPIFIKGQPQYTGTWEANPTYGQQIDNGGRPFLVSRYKDGNTSYQAPLNSYYKISGDYRPVLPGDDPRVIAAVKADAAARANVIEEELPPAFTRQYTITQTGRNIQPQFEENIIPGAMMPVTFEGEKGVNVQGYAPFVPSQAAAGQKLNEDLSLLDQHLANVTIELDGKRYSLTPEATTTPYIPSEKQLSNQAVARHGAVRVTSDGDWWDMDGPSDAELAAIQKDGALNFRPGEDIKAARAKGVGLSDGAEIYANPDIAPMDIQGAIAEKKRELARIKAGITNYYSSPTAQQSTSSSTVINPGDSPLRNRFMNSEEAAKVMAESQLRPVRERKVMGIDGNEYIEDMSHVSQRDLNDIFGDGGKNYNVLPSYLEAEIARAEAAYNQLMGLEAAPEIEILANTSERKAATLAEQARQLGMRAVDAEGDVKILGSIPFSSQLNLPVKRNPIQQQVDPEIAEMYRLGRLDQMDKMKGERIIYPDGQTPVVIPPQQRNIQRLSNFKVIDSPGTTITLPDGTIKVVPGTKQIIDKRPAPGEGANYGYYSTPTRQVQSGRRAITGDSYQPDWGQAYITGEQPDLTPEQQQKANEAIAKIAPWSQGQLQPMLVSPSADTYVANEIAEAVTQPRPITAADTLYFDEAMQRKPYSKARRQQQWGEAVAVPEAPQDSRFVEDYGRMYRGGSTRLPRSPQLTPVGNDRYQQLIASDNIAAPVVVEPSQEPQYLIMQDLMQPHRYTADDYLADAMRFRRGQPMTYVGSGNDYTKPEPPQFQRARRTNRYQQQVIDNDIFISPYISAPSGLPSWAIPAGLGGIYLGAAGINAWQQEQERKRQQEEMQLRRLFAG